MIEWLSNRTQLIGLCMKGRIWQDYLFDELSSCYSWYSWSGLVKMKGYFIKYRKFTAALKFAIWMSWNLLKEYFFFRYLFSFKTINIYSINTILGDSQKGFIWYLQNHLGFQGRKELLWKTKTKCYFLASFYDIWSLSKSPKLDI